MSKDFVLGVDVDGTIWEHRYPEQGPDVPGALEWLKKFQELGIKIIIWTMRSGKELDDVVKWYMENSIEVYGVNHNPTQDSWTSSPKAYCQHFLDDANIGCPLTYPFLGKKSTLRSARPYVNWKLAGPKVLKAFKEHNKKYGN